MNRITEWIKRHQVLAFFILAYAITWPGLFLGFFIFPGNQLVEALASPIVFSPAIAAMLIAGIAEPRPRHPRSRSRWIAFLITWLAASTIGVLYSWKVQRIELQAGIIVFRCLFALFPAWVVSSVYARNPGIREHFSTLLKPKGPVFWYLVVFLIFPGVQLLDMGITRLLGGEVYFKLAGLGFEGAAIFLSLEFAHGFLMTGGINEESGWRGFVIPRLQARYPVIVSIGIVWFFWALWHIPYDIGTGVPPAWILENRLVWTLVFAILLAWLYNRTNGSILAPALLHSAMNTFGNNLGSGEFSNYIFIGLAIFSIVFDRMWKKLPPDHPAVYQSPEQVTLELSAAEVIQVVAIGAETTSRSGSLRGMLMGMRPKTADTAMQTPHRSTFLRGFPLSSTARTLGGMRGQKVLPAVGPVSCEPSPLCFARTPRTRGQRKLEAVYSLSMNEK